MNGNDFIDASGAAEDTEVPAIRAYPAQPPVELNLEFVPLTLPAEGHEKFRKDQAHVVAQLEPIFLLWVVVWDKCLSLELETTVAIENATPWTCSISLELIAHWPGRGFSPLRHRLLLLGDCGSPS